MKILFIAPRFHTNQLPIVKTLINRSIEIDYIVQYKGAIECYSKVVPKLMKQSLFMQFNFCFSKMLWNEKENSNIKFNPSIFNLLKLIKESNPDLVVVREKSLTSRKAYTLCKLLRIKCILYNQASLYRDENNSLIYRIAKAFFNFSLPKIRYTPVYVSNYYQINQSKEMIIDKHSYFIPFITSANKETENRSYLRDGIVNFLVVGKYREYKNHYLTICAAKYLKENYNFRITVIGQKFNKEEIEYYDKLYDQIKKEGLTDYFELLYNVEPERMSFFYLQNDVFILPTLKEAASISILESMSNAMPVISTSMNGTATYITENKSGFIYPSNDAIALAKAMEIYLKDINLIKKHGKFAYSSIIESYSGNNYVEAFNRMLEKENIGIQI